MEQNYWYVIVNPNASSGKALKYWKKTILTKLNAAQILFTHATTEYVGHGIVLAHNAILQGYRKIIAVGGDGTFNEVVNGILMQKEVPSTDITLALVPAGTGNDWIKTHAANQNINDTIEIIKNGKTYLHDVGLATYHDGIIEKQRYFLNVAGTGFDAYVGKRMGNATKKFGKLTYFIEILKGLLSWNNIPMVVQSKVADVKDKIFSMNVSICKYFGSGVKIAPNAIPNDGLFDITLIKNISKIGVLNELRRLYDGSFIKNAKVQTFRTKDISVSSTKKIYLQVDGETLGNGPIAFKVLPQSIKVLVANNKEA